MKKRTITLISSAAAVLLLAGGGVAVAMNQPADEPVQKKATVSVVEETAPTVEPSAEPTVEPAPVEAPAPAPVVEPAPAPAPPPPAPPAAPTQCPAGTTAQQYDGNNNATACLPDACMGGIGGPGQPTNEQCVVFKP